MSKEDKKAKASPYHSAKKTDDLATLKKERDDYLAGWQRALADYKNLSASLAQEKKIARQAGQEQVLVDFIALADSFDMAFANQNTWQAVDENWRQGVEQIYAQMEAIFNSYDLIKIKPELGDEFDPLAHESVGFDEITEVSDEGKITTIVKAGYQMAGKVIRPAQVKVGHWAEEE